MAELDCKNRTDLHTQAMDLAAKTNNDWMITLLRAMDPKAMSQADIDTCEVYLEGA